MISLFTFILGFLFIKAADNLVILKGNEGEHPSQICARNNCYDVRATAETLPILMNMLSNSSIAHALVGGWHDQELDHVVFANGTVAPFNDETNPTYHAFCAKSSSSQAPPPVSLNGFRRDGFGEPDFNLTAPLTLLSRVSGGATPAGYTNRIVQRVPGRAVQSEKQGGDDLTIFDRFSAVAPISGGPPPAGCTFDLVQGVQSRPVQPKQQAVQDLTIFDRFSATAPVSGVEAARILARQYEKNAGSSGLELGTAARRAPVSGLNGPYDLEAYELPPRFGAATLTSENPRFVRLREAPKRLAALTLQELTSPGRAADFNVTVPAVSVTRKPPYISLSARSPSVKAEDLFRGTMESRLLYAPYEETFVQAAAPVRLTSPERVKAVQAPVNSLVEVSRLFGEDEGELFGQGRRRGRGRGRRNRRWRRPRHHWVY